MKQELMYITCSGANEFTDIAGMVSLSMKYPLIEWGIQVSGKKCSQGTPRWNWIHELHRYLQEKNQAISLALHMNVDWVENFTRDEQLIPEVQKLLELKDVDEEPFFQRIQLNFKLGRELMPLEHILIPRLREYEEKRYFIFSYNDKNAKFIHHLYAKGLRDFDVLFDSSHGEGASASTWQQPAFYDEGILQGYAGGLSPENVTEEVAKIREVVGDRAFCIDAEGNLKGEDKHLSLAKCEQYVTNALKAMM